MQGAIVREVCLDIEKGEGHVEKCRDREKKGSVGIAYVPDSPPQISEGKLTTMIVITIVTQGFTRICTWMQE